MKFPLILTVFLFALIGYVFGHAEMYQPRPRRDGQFCCGDRGDGVGKSQPTVPGHLCGLCGEIVDELSKEGVMRPRDSEFGGIHGRDGNVAVYKEGQWIHVRAGLPNPHGNFMEFRLSPNAFWEGTRDQYAFSYLLEVSMTSYKPEQNATDAITKPYVSQNPRLPTRIYVNVGGPFPVYVHAMVKLPAGLVCERCVLQYNYRAGSTETFRSCSDIRIVPANPPFDLLLNEETGQCLSVADDEKTLKLAPCNASDSYQSVMSYQAWDDYYKVSHNKIAIYSTNLCLDIPGGKTDNGAKVIADECDAGPKHHNANQRWTFTQAADGSFLIKSESSDRFFSVAQANGAVVVYDNLDDGDQWSRPYSQVWRILRANVKSDVVPVSVNRPKIDNGIMYCPGRESGIAEGCWDIPQADVPPTPKFTRLMNVETGKCLSQCVNNSLILAPCDSSDPLQSVTLFQRWDQYKNWNHGIGLSSNNCLDFTRKWPGSGIGDPIEATECLLSMNNYMENQMWGTKTNDNGATFQIFSESYGFCLTAARHSGKAHLSTCYDNPSVAIDYQYWKLVNDQVTPPKLAPSAELTPPYNVLKNVESGKCLSIHSDNQLGLVKCNYTDLGQSVTLFEPWTKYEEWNNGISLGSKNSCIYVDKAWDERPISDPVQDCKLTANNYLDKQFWGTRKAKNGTYQIFLQTTDLWLTASRKTDLVWMYDRFENQTVAKYNQFWTFIDNQRKANLTG